MNVLGLVTARGGSNGLPRKNIRMLCGHPLLAYSIAASRQARSISRTICSTDDDDIAAIAAKYGAEVPFRRPAELATATTLDWPVVAHAVRWLTVHEDWPADIIVHLRPTSPIRLAGQIDRAIQLLLDDPEADAVRAVCTPPCTPYKMWTNEGAYLAPLLQLPGNPEPYNTPRQQLPPVLWQTGSVDVLRRGTLLTHGSMTGRRVIGMVVPWRQGIDIDTESSLREAAQLLRVCRCIRP